MDSSQVYRHKLTNIVHSVVLIGAMIGLLGLLGWLLAGLNGLIWTAVIGALFFVLAPRISPAMILKMYHARLIEPHAATHLYEIVRELTRRAELPAVPRIHYLPSRVMNAFTMGRPTESVIVLSDGLLRAMKPRELLGVVAHEISHIANNDMWVMALADVVSRITSALSTIGQFMLLISLPLVVFGAAPISLLGVAALIIVPTLTGLLQLALSRTREFDADLGAATLTGDPHGLASALRKLEAYQGHWWERVLLPGRKVPEPSLLRTHPPTEDRVERLLSLVPDSREPPTRLPSGSQPRIPRELLARDLRVPRRHMTGLWY